MHFASRSGGDIEAISTVGGPKESSETKAGVTGQRGDWMKRACEASARSSGKEMRARLRNRRQR